MSELSNIKQNNINLQTGTIKIYGKGRFYSNSACGEKNKQIHSKFCSKGNILIALCHRLHTIPFPSGALSAPANFFITRKAELGHSSVLHSSTCSRIFSLWCNGRSVKKKNKRPRGQRKEQDQQVHLGAMVKQKLPVLHEL